MGCFRRLFLRKRLMSIGFSFKTDNGEKFFQKHIDDNKSDEIKKVKRFCRRKLLKYRLIDDSMDRSTNYRNNFFKSCKGIFGTNVYVCAYCGKFLKKSKVRVDHIIPVYKAKNYKFYRKLLSLRGIKNVNDIHNLTPSCEKCNSKKSADTGLWIIKGLLGRSPYYVIFKELIWLIAGSILLYYLYFFILKYCTL